MSHAERNEEAFAEGVFSSFGRSVDQCNGPCSNVAFLALSIVARLARFRTFWTGKTPGPKVVTAIALTPLIKQFCMVKLKREKGK